MALGGPENEIVGHTCSTSGLFEIIWACTFLLVTSLLTLSICHLSHQSFDLWHSSVMGKKLKKKTSHKNDKEYKGSTSRTKIRRSQKKKSQKREGRSERREGCHRDHRELEKKSHKELGKMSKMSFLLVCLRYGGPFWNIGDVPFIPDFNILTTDLTIRPQCLGKTKEHEGMMFVLHTQQQLRSLVLIFTPGRRECKRNRRKRPRHQAWIANQEIKSLTRKPLNHFNGNVI